VREVIGEELLKVESRRRWSRIGNAATRQELKIVPAARAVPPGVGCEGESSPGRFAVFATGRLP
jgi:hypothetical protein